MYAFNTKNWKNQTLILGTCKNAYLKELDGLVDGYVNNASAQHLN